MRNLKIFIFVCLACILNACSNSGSGKSAGPVLDEHYPLPALGEHYPLMEYHRTLFFDFPWPNDIRRDANGLPDFDGYPGAENSFAVGFAIQNGRSNIRNFSTNGAVYFTLSAPLDATSLPSTEQSTANNSTIVLVNLEPGSSRYLERVPIITDFKSASTLNRPGNLLSILPLPGLSLEPDARYAAMLFDGLADQSGERLIPTSFISVLEEEWRAELDITELTFSRLQNQYRLVSDYRQKHLDFSKAQLLAFSVFTTEEQNHDVENISQLFNRMTPDDFIQKVHSLSFDNGCDGDEPLVHISGQIEIPNFQSGDFPYVLTGGNIAKDIYGDPQVTFLEAVTFGMAIPCGLPPQDGFGLTVFGDGYGGDFNSYRVVYALMDHAVNPSYYNQIAVSITPSMSKERLAPNIPSILDSLRLINLDPQQVLDAIPAEQGYSVNDVVGMALIYNPLNPAAAVGNQIQGASELIYLRRVFIHLSQIVEHLNVQLPQGLTASHLKINKERTGLSTQSKSSVVAPLALAAEEPFNFAFINVGSALDSAQAAYRPDLVAIWELVIDGFDGRELDIFHPLPQLIQTFYEPTTPLNYVNRIKTPNLLVAAGCGDEHVARQSSEPMGLALSYQGLVQIGDTGVEIPGLKATGIDPVALPLFANNAERGTGLFVSLFGGHEGAYYYPWPGELFYATGNGESPNFSSYDVFIRDCTDAEW